MRVRLRNAFERRVLITLFGGECVEWDNVIFILASTTSLGMVAMGEHTESCDPIGKDLTDR